MYVCMYVCIARLNNKSSSSIRTFDLLEIYYLQLAGLEPCFFCQLNGMHMVIELNSTLQAERSMGSFLLRCMKQKQGCAT